MTDNSSQKTKQNTNSNTKVLHRFQKKKLKGVIILILTDVIIILIRKLNVKD